MNCTDCGKEKVGSDTKVSYGRKCRLCWNARQAIHRKRYADKRAADQRAYLAHHVQENRDRVKQWRADNPEKLRARRVIDEQARRARKAAIPGSYTKDDWDEIVRRQDGRCASCQTETKLTVDHIIPISKPGSSNWPHNLQGLCGRCNSSKGNRVLLLVYRDPNNPQK